MHTGIKIKQELINHAKITLSLLCLWSATAHAVEYTGEQYRDPFRQESASAAPETPLLPASLEGFSLQGILWSSTTPQAIVNGEVVKVGQRVGGAEVASIERRRVRLLINGEERYLSIEKRL